MVQALVLILIGAAGIWFSVRHLRRHFVEIRARKGGAVKTSELFLNHGLSLLWFGYLLAFFTGLIVNNLLLK